MTVPPLFFMHGRDKVISITGATRLGAAAVLAGLLAACSSEPGPDNIKDAIRNNPQAMMSLSMLARADAMLSGSAPADPGAMLDRAKVEKASCAPASGMTGVVCDYRIGADAGGQTRFGPWGKARFFRANGAWQMSDMQ